MSDLDLDINNYSINDLEKFFRFKKNSNYEAKDVELRETEIREQLLRSGHIDKRMKKELMQFLEKAKNILISANCPAPRQPTIIPKNYRLDKDEFPAAFHPPSRESELVVREKTPFMYTQTSEYFPGEINPLKTRIISKCLTIDTRFRDHFYTTSSTDFTFQMPLKLSKVVSMQLSSFEIPVSFYGISASYGNNFLYMKITFKSHEYDDEPLRQERIFIVPDGNYNAQDLIDKINGLICPKNFDGSPLYPNDMFTYVEFFLDVTETGSGTGKVILRPTGLKECEIINITMDFTKDIQGNADSVDISSKIGWNLGFTQKYYDNSRKYTSDTLIEPASIRYIYLAVDDFNNSVNNHFITAFNQSILNPNILARISIKGTYFSLLMENDLNIVTEPRKYFGPVDIQRLRIRLYDDHGRILEMNNANYSFCLIFKMIYDL